MPAVFSATGVALPSILAWKAVCTANGDALQRHWRVRRLCCLSPGCERLPAPACASSPVQHLASTLCCRDLHCRIDLLEHDSSLVERLWENARFFKRGLTELALTLGKSETPITPVIIGEGALAMQFSDRLFQEGVFAQGIVFPTVPADKCRVRTIVTALHTQEELTKALDIFEKVGKELNIILSVGNTSFSIAAATPSSALLSVT